MELKSNQFCSFGGKSEINCEHVKCDLYSIPLPPGLATSMVTTAREYLLSLGLVGWSLASTKRACRPSTNGDSFTRTRPVLGSTM